MARWSKPAIRSSSSRIQIYNLKFSAQADRAEQAFRRVLEIEPSNETAATFLQAMGAVEKEPEPKKNPEPIQKK